MTRQLNVSHFLISNTVLNILVNVIKLGAFYDPNLLTDHRGDYFRHVNAKLVQFNVRDDDDTLIPPWDMSNKLHSSTVFINATLVCWHIFTKGRGGKLDRKVRPSLLITI